MPSPPIAPSRAVPEHARSPCRGRADAAATHRGRCTYRRAAAPTVAWRYLEQTVIVSLSAARESSEISLCAGEQKKGLLNRPGVRRLAKATRVSPTPLHDPDYLPYLLDRAGRRVLMLRLSAAERAAAAFLDARGMPAQPQGTWVPLDMLVAAAETMSRLRLDWIFHIGHCGSTLLSRLLDGWPGYAALREPTPLRDIAALRASGLDRHAQSDALLSVFTRYWSRPTATAARHAIKATSGCNALVDPLIDHARDDRIVLLDMPLRPYLMTLLKSPMSVADARAAAAERAADLCVNQVRETRNQERGTRESKSALHLLVSRSSFLVRRSSLHAHLRPRPTRLTRLRYRPTSGTDCCAAMPAIRSGARRRCRRGCGLLRAGSAVRGAGRRPPSSAAR